LEGLFKGFQWPFRLLKSVKYSQSYGLNEVCDNNILTDIIYLAGFNSKVVTFFKSYLSNRCTTYNWNNFIFLFFLASIGVGQGSALSPILSTMYIASKFHLFEKCTKNLEIPLLASLLSFVDDSLLISQEKSYKKSLVILACSYSIIFYLFTVFSLVLEHEKLKVFYFSRARNDANPSLI